jgi:hypothetical protein
MVRTESWAGVREQVLALGRNSDSAGVFGAAVHGFELAEPLTEAELKELEEQLGVHLPTEYREFLLEVGAGGAGPCYGVFPLRRVNGRWRWEGDGAELTELDRLAAPFPVRGPGVLEIAALLAQRPDEERGAAGVAGAAAWAEWRDKWRTMVWAPWRTVGAIALCHLGGGTRHWLVVSGPARGHMWADDRANHRDLAPVRTPDGRPVTFAEWYRIWLDEAVRVAGR